MSKVKKVSKINKLSELIDFPQRQHEEFARLVREAVEDAAKLAELRIEDYIQKIYYQAENPPLFSSKRSLTSLYRQYSTLIESAVNSVDDASSMKFSSKAYLCYRIYLHSMTIERKVLSEADARNCLLHAMREYFYARGKILSLKDETELLNSLNQVLKQASTLTSKD